MKAIQGERACSPANLCLAWLLAIAALSGCVRQYRSPQFDPPEAQFKGVAGYLHDAAFVQVVFVHGMCTHSEKEWVDEVWDPQIRRSLEAVIGEKQSQARALTPETKYTIARRSYAIGDKQLDARFVLWSDSTTPAKKTLLFDNAPPSGEFTWKRASLNASIKSGLINDCLSDPMIYAGESGPALREMMKSALCEAIDLTYDPQAKGCREPGATSEQNRPILIVTESLGSKMVIDASLELASSSSAAAFERKLAFVPQVFMLANQLPLIDLAHPTTTRVELSDRTALPVADSATRFAKLLLESRRLHGVLKTTERSLRATDANEISIVAFTDPNDLLSYRLKPPPADQQGPFTVTNVLTSNAGALFGVIENPQTAHTGYRANEDVMKLILCGSGREDCAALARESGP